MDPHAILNFNQLHAQPEFLTMPGQAATFPRSSLTTAVFFVAAFAGSVVVRAGEPLYVGVLENVVHGNMSPGMAEPHVRVAFQKQGTDWVPLKTDFHTQQELGEALKFYPSAVKWTVVFNGKNLGELASEARPAQAYGDVGIQSITTRVTQIPVIEAGASDFSHFDNPARSRPLLVVSSSNYKDPDEWQRATLSGAESKLAIQAFRSKVSRLEHCEKPKEKPITMLSYSNDDIVLIKAYRSKRGEILVGQRLDDKRSNCGFFDDETFFDYWFVIGPAKQTRFLGSRMTPIDAADLDNLGRSEWIFQTSRGEDEDGYELFYDRFSKHAYFHWTYH